MVLHPPTQDLQDLQDLQVVPQVLQALRAVLREVHQLPTTTPLDHSLDIKAIPPQAPHRARVPTTMVLHPPGPLATTLVLTLAQVLMVQGQDQGVKAPLLTELWDTPPTALPHQPPMDLPGVSLLCLPLAWGPYPWATSWLRTR